MTITGGPSSRPARTGESPGILELEGACSSSQSNRSFLRAIEGSPCPNPVRQFYFSGICEQPRGHQKPILNQNFKPDLPVGRGVCYLTVIHVKGDYNQEAGFLQSPVNLAGRAGTTLRSVGGSHSMMGSARHRPVCVPQKYQV